MMKSKVIIGVLAAVLVVGMVAIAANEDTGNGSESGHHYNLNIIGVPHETNENFDGGNGSRIFVLRDSPTQFYVHGDDTTSYAVLDHDGTDGVVGTSRTSPGITFPYDSTDPVMTWQADVYMRLVGPKTSKIHWTTEYWDGVEWLPVASFNLEKSSKFQLKTTDLFKDDYQDILWTLDPVTKFRILQMRIYVH